MKNCVGAGVFSLSAKILSVSSITNESLLPNAAGLIVLLALWASYNFYTVTETCRMTGVLTYGDCWAETVSPKTTWLIQGITSLGPLIGCLASTIVLTDLLGGILQSLRLPAALGENRVAVVLMLCGFIIYPLCSLQDLRALQNSSLLGLAGQLLAMAVLALRVYDQSYLPGGVYNVPLMETPMPTALTQLPVSALQNSLVEVVPPTLSRWFVFTSLLSYCYVAHYNAPKYYAEMENPTSGRVLGMTLTAYIGSAVIYAASMWLGVRAFGADCKPYLLNNLSPTDPLAVIARVSIATSILAATPLMFMNVRNWLISLAHQRMPVLAGVRPMTAALVLAMGALATQITDISVIGSIAGGLFGTNMMFTIPPIMYIRALKQKALQTNTTVSSPTIVVNTVLAMMGAVLSVVGTFHSCKALFG